MQSTEKVKAMDLDRRQCILVDENLEETAPHVKMEAFEEYSKPSCLLECRARRMFEDCDCLPYYYPNFQKVWVQGMLDQKVRFHLMPLPTLLS